MRLADLQNHVSLHDSYIDDIDYMEPLDSLVLDLQLTGDVQPDADERTPDFIDGKLVFYDVARIVIRPAQQIETVIDGEIMYAEPLDDQPNSLRLDVMITDHELREDNFVTIEVHALDVEWLPREKAFFTR